MTRMLKILAISALSAGYLLQAACSYAPPGLVGGSNGTNGGNGLDLLGTLSLNLFGITF